jgi:hypothetical protein
VFEKKEGLIGFYFQLRMLNAEPREVSVATIARNTVKEVLQALVPWSIKRLCISSPHKLFGPKTIFRETVLLMPILFKVTQMTGLWIDLHWLSNFVCAVIVYPILAM